MYEKFQEFFPAIKRLKASDSLTKKDLLADQFLIEKEQNLSMFYAPHNEYINNIAKVVIVGITPGWSQMKTAYEQLLRGINSHHTIGQLLKDVKKAASFSGSMRSNLIQMLDECGVHEALKLDSSTSLFNDFRHLLHTTSVIKYPVFYKEKNYTGHQPSIKNNLLLTKYAFDIFPEEINQFQQPTLIVPLGKIVEHVFKVLLREGKLPEQNFYLFGFPHPSGANGHRKKQLYQHKDLLVSEVLAWKNTLS